jgi:hypothetical protein
MRTNFATVFLGIDEFGGFVGVPVWYGMTPRKLHPLHCGFWAWLKFRCTLPAWAKNGGNQ